MRAEAPECLPRRGNMAKELTIADIERLENTSFASVFAGQNHDGVAADDQMTSPACITTITTITVTEVLTNLTGPPPVGESDGVCSADEGFCFSIEANCSDGTCITIGMGDCSNGFCFSMGGECSDGICSQACNVESIGGCSIACETGETAEVLQAERDAGLKVVPSTALLTAVRQA